MLRSLLVAALLTASPSTAPIVEQQEVGPVPLVVCHEGPSYISGSAFRVGPGYFISANHVTSNSNCQIEGQPVKVRYHSGDYSLLADYRPGKFLTVDCSGFHEGQHLLGIGHARGTDSLTVVPLIATGASVLEHGQPFAVLVGIFEFQPGMSGGAVIDADTHKVVGIVNAADWESGTSFSIALADTPVCRQTIA